MMLLTSLLSIALAQAPLASPLAPASSKTLALDDVLLAVEGEHPLLDASRADAESSGADLLAARGAFDPTLKARGGFIPISGYTSTRFDVVLEQPTPLYGLNLFAGYRLGQGDFPVYYGERATNSLGEVRAGLDLPLLRNGWVDRRRTTIARARQGQVAAQASLEQQRLDLARLAASRYWDWVGAGRRREIARSLLTI
ncbi:MAG: TolC family protein, partial [Archangium sp.]|nr:TolC family protein [Archangium sp.]